MQVSCILYSSENHPIPVLTIRTVHLPSPLALVKLNAILKLDSLCMSGDPSRSCISSPSSTVSPLCSATGATDHSELAVPMSTVAPLSSAIDLPATDQSLLPPTSTAAQPSSAAGRTDHSELAVPLSTVAPSSVEVCFPAADHNYSQNSTTPKSGKQRVHVLDISPYPKCKQAERRQKKSQKAEVLTSSPYKKAVEEKSMQSKPKPLKRKKQAPASSEVKKKRTRVVKTLNDAVTKKRKKSGKQQDMTPCGICKVRFCDDVHEANGRKWIACSICNAWFHNECQGLETTSRRSSAFICISCEN